MTRFFRYATLILLSVVLISCQSSKKTEFKQTGFHITDVNVQMPPQDATHKVLQYTDGFGVMLDNTLSRNAAEYNATKANATNAYVMNVTVEKVHFKNALASLLVGDANHMSGTVRIVDSSSGQQIHSFPFHYVDAASAALNGITGAVLSAVVKKEAAEGTMSKGVAKIVMQKVYPGTKLPESAKSRLKNKTVFTPMTTAMSPLSNPVVVTENSSEVENSISITE